MKQKKHFIEKVHDRVRFGIAATLLSPQLVLEDALRLCKVDVPAKGIFFNHDGDSIMDIWRQSKPVNEAEKLANEAAIDAKISAANDNLRMIKELMAN